MPEQKKKEQSVENVLQFENFNIDFNLLQLRREKLQNL